MSRASFIVSVEYAALSIRRSTSHVRRLAKRGELEVIVFHGDYYSKTFVTRESLDRYLKGDNYNGYEASHERTCTEREECCEPTAEAYSGGAECLHTEEDCE